MGNPLGFTSRQVTAATGISNQVLTAWVHSRICTPSIQAGRGRGTRRVWSFSDLVGLRTILNLRKQGVPLQRVRKMLVRLKQYTLSDSNLQALATSRLVVSSDGDVALVETSEQLVSLLSGQITAAVFVEMSQAMREVQEKMLAESREDLAMAGSILVLQKQGAWLLDQGVA